MVPVVSYNLLIKTNNKQGHLFKFQALNEEPKAGNLLMTSIAEDVLDGKVSNQVAATKMSFLVLVLVLLFFSLPHDPSFHHLDI